MQLNKSYEPQQFEDNLYRFWSENGFFTPTVDGNKKPFTIMMPPPNITGELHMGHALGDTVQDCIIRYKRMQGFAALWLPGTDHASIATEMKICSQLAKEGQSKRGLGREQFLVRAWQWKKQYGNRITDQIKKLGCSCDWSREAFTMDERCSRAVRHTFVDLYNRGLIYQGFRIIGWCTECKTALSDAEVIYEEHDSFLWHFKYLSEDGKGSLSFATTRPETLLGDTALAVNPNDKRYTHLIGKTFRVPFVNRLIPVVADEYVDMEFGTGVVKITPAHDPNDYEVGQRHKLPAIKVIDDDGKMNNLAALFDGMDVLTARKAVVKEMEKLGLLIKIEPHKHNIGHCDRCKSVVQPALSKQWFVSMKTLAEPALEAVKNGEVVLTPKRHEKTYYNWMENIRDWCISRQLWWGHRIPVFYCRDCNNVECSETDVVRCGKCGSSNIKQDEDVLDTWFSSALWPFSTLGYLDNTEDFNYFYPGDVLVTAYDILFFWVARMIFSAIDNTGKVPFSQVLFTGLVRDGQGIKMSKTLGNGIDPLEFINTNGADALRFSLLNGVANGGDIRFAADKAENNRNFMNKIWNASRFLLLNAENCEIKPLENCKLSLADKWILHKLNEVIDLTVKDMDSYELGSASARLYEFVWNEYCDWYIELSKPCLYGTDKEARTATVSTLCYTLSEILKLLHPFVPFITEELYQQLPGKEKTIMLCKFPSADKKFEFGSEADKIEKIKEIVSKIRMQRAEMNVTPSKRIRISIYPAFQMEMEALTYIEKLAGSDNVTIAPEPLKGDNLVVLITSCADIFIPLNDMVDVEKESARLKKEILFTESEIKRAEAKLQNQGFLGKAPTSLIDEEKEKLEKYRQMKLKLDQQLGNLVSEN